MTPRFCFRGCHNVSVRPVIRLPCAAQGLLAAQILRAFRAHLQMLFGFEGGEQVEFAIEIAVQRCSFSLPATNQLLFSRAVNSIAQLRAGPRQAGDYCADRYAHNLAHLFVGAVGVAARTAQQCFGAAATSRAQQPCAATTRWRGGKQSGERKGLRACARSRRRSRATQTVGAVWGVGVG
jgi:hypothetical protein